MNVTYSQETVMERMEHIDDALIDLGAASVETQGGLPIGMELDQGRDTPGLSED